MIKMWITCFTISNGLIRAGCAELQHSEAFEWQRAPDSWKRERSHRTLCMCHTQHPTTVSSRFAKCGIPWHHSAWLTQPAGLRACSGPGSVSVASTCRAKKRTRTRRKNMEHWRSNSNGSFAFWWFPYPLVNVNKKLWKDPPFSMGKSTISMVIFNSYVKLPEGMGFFRVWPCLEFGAAKPEHKPSDPRRWATASLWRTFRYGSRRNWVRHSHPRAKCSANC